jgi:outer membrane protein TolC
MPIFINSLRKETVRSGLDAECQVASQIEERREQITVSVTTSMSNLTYAREEIKAAESQIDDTKERLRQAEMRFRNGLGNEADVLAALSSLANSEYTLTGARIDEMEAQLRILLLQNPDWMP